MGNFVVTPESVMLAINTVLLLFIAIGVNSAVRQLIKLNKKDK